MKNVLVIYYTQSGQLLTAAQHVVANLQKDANVAITYYNIEMEKPFPFPWPASQFFDAFPETFKQIPATIKAPPSTLFNQKFDLVILAYQVWYLSPSIPINSFLKSEYAKTLLQNMPVITLSGSRNMWVKAQEKVKVLLQQNQANLVGNIAMVDRNINLVSVITIVDWMFTGIKRKVWGFLPLPGISEQEMQASTKFGTIILKHLNQNNYESLQTELVANGAVEVRHFLVSMDQKANKMFKAWSNLVLKFPKKRKFLLKLFYYYLFIAIWFLSPIVHLIHTITLPLQYWKIKKQKKYYQGIQLK
ncbi:dialkylresorcinol condensing enzyme DarA [Flavobacterium agricola]|uniref:Dialkylresorcinol condensing enzyme DarA n=1 Tax=Flavobacterium agricola TaxID=2870839 RepID=A0ABY6LXN9_9FLAO|nr:dialkylrecorsinol condensing enzyme DarA [Flavobacterium agricola]UYW01004.1 dialkylresorcinol condensing enzyme DarA [Flavobacterium agricola]